MSQLQNRGSGAGMQMTKRALSLPKPTDPLQPEWPEAETRSHLNLKNNQDNGDHSRHHIFIN